MSLSLRDTSKSWDSKTYARVTLGLVIPGLGLTMALLALYGYAAWNLVSRRYLDRVSFRLLTYALVANLVFGVSFTMSAVGGSPGWRCSLSTFLANSSLMFSSCIFFCIALNVPLVVVQNINGRAMEKYYVAGTTLICLICNVVPYASGNLGHVLIPTKMGRSQPDLLTSWIIITVVGEVGAFLIILGYLVTHEIHLLRRPAHTEATYSSQGAGSTILKLRNIILRIGLYPLASCVLNLTVAVFDLHEFIKLEAEASESTKLDMILMFANVASCAGRPLIYGLLAATDPSFIRALHALRNPEAEAETQFYGRSGCLSTIVDIPLHEISSFDSEALDNHMRSTMPGPGLEVGKEWRSYLEHDTSGATTSLSISRPAPTLPAIDVVCHI
ncbi:hypothetical protein DFH08DRAFT_976227 [Mycena albidolilacea]|uniref:Uncharacterized protein n=1 Tax=Mycena albidolilacea TaxID=1033008 RepID=A0AAD6Z372_9AGAR|nr:hypothetical protein DFH08DRAFT_976227 [Mycena albidolilacea]